MRDWRNEIRSFLAKLDLDPGREAEIIEELNQHLSDRYQELIAQGSSPEQAHQLTMEELNGGKLAEELRTSVKQNRSTLPPAVPERQNGVAELWQNLRYGVRLLRFNPGFSAIMILSLALGIGANTAIFQLINAVRLRTLPVEKPQELANIKITKSPKGRTGRFTGASPQLTYQIWEKVKEQQQGFSKVGVWYSQRLNLNRGGEARYVRTLFVSGTFFDVIGIRPVIGRLIADFDDQRSCGSSAALLSESFWYREYGGNRSALGRKIMIEGRPFEIAGVTPASFFGIEVGTRFDVVLPLCAEQFIHAEDPFLKSADTWWIAAIGRLKPDWTLDRASAQLDAISKGIFESTIPDSYSAVDKKDYTELVLGAVAAENGLSNVRRQYENPLWLLLAISGFVLLIACANLANLMIARASARQKEMAVRLALGASRGRLIRQMLAESMMLAFVGALLGAGLAQVLSRTLISFLSTQRSTLFLDLQPDWRVISFTTLLAFLTCAFFGLMPALQASRTPPGEAMKANSRGLTSGRSRFQSRRLLVVTQVALSLVLLVGALLFVRTFHNLTSLDAGFEQDRMLVSSLDFTHLKVPQEQRVEYKRRILERIRSLRTVQFAASVSIVPLSGSGWNEYVTIPELNVGEVANFNSVSDGYFETVGTKMIAGRDFNQTDAPNGPLVAIVTQSFVKKFLKQHQNPIGINFRLSQAEGQPDRVYQIIGLVNDAKYLELREDFSPIVYVPQSQDKEPDQEAVVIVRSGENLSDVIASIKTAAREIHPSINLEFTIFRNLVRDGLLRERLMATLSGFFGFLAAILAMIGLYGVISYMVVRRRNEIGIRIALGADRHSILSMIMREATTLLIAGLAVGTFLALITASVAKALIFGMQPNDPVTILFSVLGLGLIALLASLLPAQRAARLNPIQALREE